VRALPASPTVARLEIHTQAALQNTSFNDTQVLCGLGGVSRRCGACEGVGRATSVPWPGAHSSCRASTQADPGGERQCCVVRAYQVKKRLVCRLKNRLRLQ
jgi:hypothetical protein